MIRITAEWLMIRGPVTGLFLTAFSLTPIHTPDIMSSDIYKKMEFLSYALHQKGLLDTKRNEVENLRLLVIVSVFDLVADTS